MAGPRRVVNRFASGREIVTLGLAGAPWSDAYHRLLTMPWHRFFALLLVAYLLVNGAFAAVYWELGDAIENAVPDSFLDDFFFSVQTLATIGYGKMAPRTLGANAVVAIEALVGMVGLAVTTGLVYARFARPTARVLFSKVAVVAPYEGVPSLMFRMANARGNQIVEARLRVTLVVNEVTREGRDVRRLHDLHLVRSEHAAFALSWTAVHPIDAASPLAGRDGAWLGEGQADIIVSLSGVDEGLAQSIYARHVYGAGDVVWNARFADILDTRSLRTVVDFSRFHDTVPLGPRPLAAEAPGRGSAGNP
ncbi:MAG TPA: ion channel [Anaeromyxobacteraceae bacterium]|nr:ion channel [Anaeromyxobacteraceae bacterium]